MPSRSASGEGEMEVAAHPSLNRLEIIARGTKIRGIPALRNRPQEGYLLLQNHGHKVEFRDVRLVEEKAAAGPSR